MAVVCQAMATERRLRTPDLLATTSGKTREVILIGPACIDLEVVKLLFNSIPGKQSQCSMGGSQWVVQSSAGSLHDRQVEAITVSHTGLQAKVVVSQHIGSGSGTHARQPLINRQPSHTIA